MGGTLRTEVALYANINRMTLDRSPDGFARSARRVSDAGFATVKAAPFDGFPARSAGIATVQRATDRGIDCLLAMRAAVGDEVAIRVDCHSHFDFARAVDVAWRLKPAELDWYEEPVAPSDAITTARINASIPQRMAGGERLFGVVGFAPLCRRGVVDVIMPDVMHCGGLLEGRHIAALAASVGISVSPHNACGPVATAAAVQLAAGIEKFDSLELQWGEVDWRADITKPPEYVRDGTLTVPTGPGLGIELNDAVVDAHLTSAQ
jgi:galactonate dehydratase